MKKIRVSDILVPVSDVASDKAVIHKALRVALRMKASITFLHIRKGRLTPTQGIAFMEKSDDDFAEKELRDFIEEANVSKKVKISISIIDHFDIASAISEQSVEFEMLVIGHHSDNFFDQIFGGHTLANVLNKVSCDVFVVKTSSCDPITFAFAFFYLSYD